ncbi:MAG: hypothetical protein M1834_005225 [Cirrosporium novae-zelandiae]|nr:MAG: hypothetical protein M1834_005225 [Cirrosporium novae-zelandiae]
MNDHLGGLKEMVKLLGGYEKIRANNGLLGSLVEMLDRLFYATQPRGFSILRRESEVFAPLIEFPNQSQLFSLSKTGIIPVSDPILPLLFAVFKTWDSQFARNNPGYNRVNFVNGCACLYQKIISMEQVNLITETLQDNIFLFQACRLAGLVFSSRGLNLPPKTVQLWVHSLKTRMEPLCHGGTRHNDNWMGDQVKPVAVTVRNKTSELRMNQIQIVGTHNSYHRETYLEERPAMEIMLSDPQNYYYSHASLKDQLSYQSVRNLELDLWPDPEGGLYATPLIRRLAGLDPPSDPAMNKSGTKILHVSDAEVGTSCHTLVECLTEVKEWSIANPSHVPIPFMVEFKHTDSSMEYLGGVHSPRWTNTTLLDALDEEIRSVFSDEQMITPDDVRHEDMTLEQSILNYGWPTLEEARGKVLFLMDDGSKPLGDVRDAYRANGHESLEGRVIFTQSNPGETDAAFLKRNDPMGNNLATIQKLVTKGYWVRTRADVPIDTVLSGSTIMRDNAFASGAQIVSTDFPGVGMAARYKSDYVVRLPGGAAARCNPINSPASCNGTVLEKLS